MHCRSQHCWEFLGPFAHRCQQGRNNSQHCWLLLHPFAHHCQHRRNNSPTFLVVVASVCTPLPTQTQQLPTLLVCCCIRLQTTANTDATTRQHCWGVVASVCTPLLTQTQQLPNIVGVLLHPFANHCQHRRSNNSPTLLGCCCIRLHTTANTDATTPNIVVV